MRFKVSPSYTLTLGALFGLGGRFVERHGRVLAAIPARAYAPTAIELHDVCVMTITR